MTTRAQLVHVWSDYCAEPLPGFRIKHVQLMGTAWWKNPPAVKWLIRALGDPGRYRPGAAPSSERRVGDVARELLLRRPAAALPPLALLLDDPTASEGQLPPSPHYAREHALFRAIEIIDVSDAASYLPSVVTAFTLLDVNLRQRAARCLGRAGATNSEARAVIGRCLKSNDRILWAGAARACLALKPIDLAPFADDFVRLLDDDRPGVRSIAASLLGRVGRTARRHSPMLVAALGRKDRQLTPILLEALAAFGTSDPALIAAVGVVLGDPQSSLTSRLSAYKVLGSLGPRASSLLPTLKQLMETASEIDREHLTPLIRRVSNSTTRSTKKVRRRRSS